MRKALILVAVAVGYVLGSKAGRQRYDQIRDAAAKVGSDPRIQEAAQQAAGLARDTSATVKEAVTDTAAAARAKVGKDGN